MKKEWRKPTEIKGYSEEKQYLCNENFKEEDGIFKALMAENFLNLGRGIDIWIYNTQKTTNRLNLNRVMSRYVIIKLSKVKRLRKNFKNDKEKERCCMKGHFCKTVGKVLNRNF